MDFETMIREARDNGVSINDIAKMFSKTLNAVQQEEQKQNSVANKRDHLESTFYESIAKGQLDAAALFTLTMAEKYTDWTAKDIEDFFGTIQMTARTTAELIGKSPEEIKSDDEKIAEFLKLFG